MKLLLWSFAICTLLPFTMFAQETSRSRYEAYLADRQKAYKDFIDSRNAEYIRYMKQQWSKASEQPAIQAVPQPAPVIPPAPPSEEVGKREIRVEKVVPKPAPLPEPERPATTTPTQPAAKQLKFAFLGAACSVADAASPKPMLQNASESSVAMLWEAFSAPAYRNVVADGLRLKKELQLNDWGYLKLLETMAAQVYPDRRNEAVLLQIFLLTQSGYKVRIARTGDRLVLLMPSMDMLFGYRYIQLGKEKYFVIGNQPAPDGYHIFDRAFPGERALSMFSDLIPNLPERPAPMRKLASKRFPGMSVEVSANRNIVDFYNLYPVCDVPVYTGPSLSKSTKEKLYTQLRPAMAGKSSVEAADMLLDFVQTAFEYKTDPEQFGRERPLFAEETLYYPYCDCEDRAVLYALLVRELLGLNTVLLQYPEHVATAVRFNEEVAGDYIRIDSKRYTVCDPTYIGAGIGRTMPGMDNKTVQVLLK